MRRVTTSNDLRHAHQGAAAWSMTPDQGSRNVSSLVGTIREERLFCLGHEVWAGAWLYEHRSSVNLDFKYKSSLNPELLEETYHFDDF